MKTLKMTENHLKSLNILISGPYYHCDTFFIEPVISYDKFIDVMNLNETYLICIFININKNVENRGKKGKKTIAISRFWMGYKIYLSSLKSILMAVSMVRGTTLIP